MSNTTLGHQGDTPESEINDDENKHSLITTTYECRRKHFYLGIQSIQQEIISLKDGLEDIDNRRFYLTLLIYKLQQRALFLQAEIARVGACTGHRMSSKEIHSGAEQIVQKKVLLLEFQRELEKTLSDIAESTYMIIFGCREHKKMTIQIRHRQALLDERQRALNRFETIGQNISNVGKLVNARCEEELVRYCFVEWRRKAHMRARFRRLFLSLISKEQKYLRQGFNALKQWCGNRKFTSKINKESTGKFDKLLEHALIQQSDVVADASSTLRDIIQLKHLVSETMRLDSKKMDVEKWLVEHNSGWLFDLPQALLATVIEGDTLLSTQHYEKSLKCYLLALEEISTNHQCLQPVVTSDVCLAYIYGRIGNAYAKLEQYSIAAMYHHRQYAVALEADNSRCQIISCVSLGCDYQGELDHVSAKEWFDEALQKSIAARDDHLQTVSHRALQLLCEKLNFADAASKHSAAIQSIVSKQNQHIDKVVDSAIQLQTRLMNGNAKEVVVVKLERSTNYHLTLKKKRSMLQSSITKALNDKSYLAIEIQRKEDSLEKVYTEIKECCSKKPQKISSRCMHGLLQVIDSNVLQEILKVDAKKLNDGLENLIKKAKQKDAGILNLQYDLEGINQDISVEDGPLISKVMKPFEACRCMQFNYTNTSLNDVNCSHTNQSIPFLVVSKGSSIYVNHLRTGELQAIFSGDEYHTLHAGETHGHRTIVTCLFFRDQRVFSGSMDKSIMCWDIETERRVFVAKGHEGTVTCLWVDHEKMISGSADSFIIIWDKDTGAMFRRVSGHMRGILTLECGLTWCISGGSDGVIYVWQCRSRFDDPEFNEFTCKTTLRFGDACKITALSCGALQVVSGNNLGKVVLWWLKTEEIIQSCDAHKGSVTSLQFDATRIVSSGADGNVCVIDIFTGYRLATLRSDQNTDVRVESIAFDSEGISGAYTDGSIRRFQWVSSSWDAQATSIVDTLNGVKDASFHHTGMRILLRKKETEKEGEVKQEQQTNVPKEQAKQHNQQYAGSLSTRLFSK